MGGVLLDGLYYRLSLWRGFASQSWLLMHTSLVFRLKVHLVLSRRCASLCPLSCFVAAWAKAATSKSQKSDCAVRSLAWLRTRESLQLQRASKYVSVCSVCSHTSLCRCITLLLHWQWSCLYWLCVCVCVCVCKCVCAPWAPLLFLIYNSVLWEREAQEEE